MRMTRLEGLVPMPEALRRLLDAVEPVHRTEEVPLANAVGRVAARSVRAPRPIPAFRRATWDGYAFRSRDTTGASPRAPVRLRVVGELHAEESLRHKLGRGECAAVATGAPLPPGADTVEMFEEVRERPGAIELTHRVPAGQSLAEPGEDIRQGAVLLREGDVLTPARLGAVGATGARTQRVFVRPTVALVPNGNELASPGTRLRAGQIHEFNNVTLGALVQASGGIPLPLPPVPDDPITIEGVLEGALRQADLVIATGGSSVGERDHLPTIFPRLGTLLFHGIRVRPGKPTLAAKVGNKVLLGMPGHPTSCLSNGFWLLLPALRRLAGLPGDGTEPVEARLSVGAEGAGGGFATIVPVELRGGRARPTFHGSASITSLTSADGFVVLPAGLARLRAGASVVVRRFPVPLRPAL
jgi:molybdopterin molybdotransferase